MPEPTVRRSWSIAFALGTLASVAAGFAVGAFCYWIASTAAAYGAWLFVLLPTLMGVAGSFVVNWRRTEDGGFGFGISFVVFLLAGVILLAVQAEGLICLGMAAPLYFPLYWIGYFLARYALNLRHEAARPTLVSAVPLLAFASVAGARSLPEEEVRTQATTMEIDAPPEAIWPYLFEMRGVPAPSAPAFRVGVAHPVEIRSAGRGVGARRECVLSTGVMPETIVAAEPGRLLRFRVLSTPAAMREINPFGEVHARHLHGYYTVREGEFRLVPLPGGRTRVVGTSRYALRIFPVAYWDLWTDDIVDEIHRAVIGEMKRRVEARKPRGSGARSASGGVRELNLPRLAASGPSVSP